MSLFDDIVINARSAANTVGKTVGKKAGQLKDYSKLKYSESGIKSEIAKKKQALGDYVYACTKIGEVNQEKMQAMVDEITELEENLQITQEMLVVAKNKIVCNECKAENEKESIFCCKCGQKLSGDEESKKCNCNENNCDVTVVASSSVDDITSTPAEAEEVAVEAEELEDITVAEKTDETVSADVTLEKDTVADEATEA